QIQTLAAESILQGRVLRTTSGLVSYGGIGLIMLLTAALWRRFPAGVRAFALLALAGAVEAAGTPIQAHSAVGLAPSPRHVTVAAYVAAIALDEIDFRRLLGGIAENRFQRIAMSLGDGLVCLDHKGVITVWNPGAAAIFGYAAADMLGQTLDRICAASDGDAAFSILTLPFGTAAGAEGMEVAARRRSGGAVS